MKHDEIVERHFDRIVKENETSVLEIKSPGINQYANKRPDRAYMAVAQMNREAPYFFDVVSLSTMLGMGKETVQKIIMKGNAIRNRNKRQGPK